VAGRCLVGRVGFAHERRRGRGASRRGDDGVGRTTGRSIARASRAAPRPPDARVPRQLRAVLDAAAEVADTLLRSCPGVSILATSREALRTDGEVVWRVPSLTDDDAAALLFDRATRVRPWLALDEANEAVVRSICRRLDGIPLAIELAAACLGTLTASQVAARLEDRLALLVRAPRGAVGRQQTLAASIAWSHDLLDHIDRRVFRRLAVFAGGFTLDAACAVAAVDIDAAAVFDGVTRLVDKSLVVLEDHDGGGRYRLLETTRQFAGERLAEAGEDSVVRGRHLDYFLEFAETAEHGLLYSDQDAWLDQLSIEHENLRTALDWALAADDRVRARRLAAAMLWLWNLRGHVVEGHQYLRTAIALDPEDRTSPGGLVA
jgi:predicted ATPase